MQLFIFSALALTVLHSFLVTFSVDVFSATEQESTFTDYLKCALHEFKRP